MENRVQGLYESTVEQAEDVIKSQPVAAVVTAVGLGVVAGMLIVGLCPVNHHQRDWSASQIGKRVMESLGNLSPSSWKS